MAATAINIVRKVYPDVVDECHRLAALNGRTMTMQAAWMLRQAMGLPLVNSPVRDHSPQSVEGQGTPAGGAVSTKK